MTRIDFYILDTENVDQRQLYACRLVEKAWRLGLQVLVQTPSLVSAQALDALLWAYRPEAFVPHAICPAGKNTPVHISYGDETSTHHGLLVNLCDALPPSFSRFERIAEIVTQSSDVLAASRERYRHYRDRGYAIDNHRIPMKAAP
jgi:DNA polymerase-3 subunit chi